MAKDLTRLQSIERSLITTYRKTLWSPFVLAVKKYALVEEGDKIAVCISGGKDSMVLAKLMQQLQRISEVKFELVFVSMDPGYAERNAKKIQENAELLGIPLHTFQSEIFETAEMLAGQSPCYMCARMRRGHLYAKAKELGCNKIALGHHKSDVIETTVMGMLYAGQIQGMLPKIQSTNFEGMQLIRPLYCILEEDIIRWKNYNNLDFIACACAFSERTEEGFFSARARVKRLIKELKNEPEGENVEKNIFQSIHNVQLDTLVSYKADGKKVSFLDKFEK